MDIYIKEIDNYTEETAIYTKAIASYTQVMASYNTESANYTQEMANYNKEIAIYIEAIANYSKEIAIYTNANVNKSPETPNKNVKITSSGKESYPSFQSLSNSIINTTNSSINTASSNTVFDLSIKQKHSTQPKCISLMHLIQSISSQCHPVT